MAANPVRWFEIYVQDMKRAIKFYEATFALKLDCLCAPTELELEMYSFPMVQGQEGSGGALVKMAGVASGGNSTIVYFASSDCSIEEGRVVSAGGSIHKSKMAIGQYGFITLAVDTEGNMIGIHSME